MPANDKVLLQQQFNDFDQTYERIMIMEKNDVTSIENFFFFPDSDTSLIRPSIWSASGDTSWNR